MKKIPVLLLIPFSLSLTTISKAQTGFISTVAGINSGGYNGDNIAATSAKLNQLEGVALDAVGNLYIADQVNNRIRKVNTSGIIITIAGTGTPGYTGDNGQATSAQINNPNGVRVDAAGNVYFSDAGNIIRKIATTGIITTIAGNFAFGPGLSGDGGPATSAELNWPVGLAIDNTNNLLFFADQNNNRIRQVNLGTHVITTVAGSTMGFSGNGGPATSAKLNTPIGVAVDNSGNLYIADQVNNEIRKVSGGTITAFAGTGVAGYNVSSGPATSTQIYNPLGVWADASGDVYLTDPGDGYVREVMPSGMMYVIAGNAFSGFSGDGGAAVNAEMNYPFDVVTDASHNVYIADLGNNRVRKITPSCSVDTSYGLIYNYPECANANDGIIVAATNSPFPPYSYSWSNGSTQDSLPNLTAGTYTVTITDALGCAVPGIISLTAPPALVVTIGSYTICAGQDVKIVSSVSGGVGGYHYAWSSDSSHHSDTITVNATATTQYTVYVYDNNGCADTGVSNITVNQLPNVSFYADQYTVCLSSTVDNLHGAPAGGTFSGPGVTGSNFDGNSVEVGTYTVTYSYTDSNNCTNEIQNAITVTICSGIQDITSDGQVTIFPNPANSVVNVMLSNDYLNSTIGLYSVTGQQLYQTANPERKQQVEIPVSQLSAGVYMLKVTQTDGTTLMRKVEVTK